MTQFVLIPRADGIPTPSGVTLVPPLEGSYAAEVAREYFGSHASARLVVGNSGAAEPLVDTFWEAQQMGSDVASTRLGQLLTVLVATGTPFVCWCGSDAFQLPVARSLHDVFEAVQRQTRTQPADLFLFYPGRL